MDLRKLKTLIDLVSDSNVSELEITEAEGKVRIVKGSNVVMQGYAPAQMQARSTVQPLPAPNPLWKWATPSRWVTPFASSRP